MADVAGLPNKPLKIKLLTKINRNITKQKK